MEIVGFLNFLPRKSKKQGYLLKSSLIKNEKHEFLLLDWRLEDKPHILTLELRDCNWFALLDCSYLY